MVNVGGPTQALPLLPIIIFSATSKMRMGKKKIIRIGYLASLSISLVFYLSLHLKSMSALYEVLNSFCLKELIYGFRGEGFILVFLFSVRILIGAGCLIWSVKYLVDLLY